MTASPKNVSASPMEREVILTRVFNAPRELVFEAWTQKEHLQRWWGPAMFTNPICEVDLRIGGSFRIVMQDPSGAQYPCEGVYKEIVPHERLVFTNIAVDLAGKQLLDGLTTVLLEDQQGKTKLTLLTYAKGLVDYAPQMLDGMEMGWSQSLDKLVEELELSAREIMVSRVFDAPRELVWQAWTEPKHLEEWWGPNGFSTQVHEMDFRPGGIWTLTMRGPDGKEYPNHSMFVEIVKPERIVYSHGGGSEGDPQADFEATWSFEEVGGKTRLTIRSLFASAEQRDLIAKFYRALEGAKQTLGRLAEYLPSIH